MGRFQHFGPVLFVFSASVIHCVGDSSTIPDSGGQDATNNDVATQDTSTNDVAPDVMEAGDGNDGALPPLTIQPMVAVGFQFSCALRASGKVYCWGANDSGQLGNLLTGSANFNAGQVANITNGAQIVAGVGFACALLTDHHVSCWGSNGFGQLGQSPNPNNPTPTTMTSIDNAVEIAGGSGHVCVRKNDSSVWCWGWNNSDQLGYANTNDTACVNNQLCNYKPTQVSGLVADSIAAGLAHTCARVGNVAKCWGSNGKGELGHAPGQNGDLNGINPTPVQASATNVTALFASSGNTCMLDGQQKVSCWGTDTSGQLGDKSAAGQSSAPIAITSMPAGFKVGMSYLSGCAVAAAGPVYCWGDDEYGELGNGTFGTTQYNATLVTGFSSKTFVSVSGDPIGDHYCALQNDGTVWCWGTNTQGEAGHQNVSDPTCNGQKCVMTATSVPGLP